MDLENDAFVHVRRERAGGAGIVYRIYRRGSGVEHYRYRLFGQTDVWYNYLDLEPAKGDGTCCGNDH